MATYNEVMATIAASSKDDWVKDDSGKHFTYKRDLNIRLEDSTDKVQRERRKSLKEPWAENVGVGHPAEDAGFTIYYGNSFVRHVGMVAVDEYRGYIPYPKRDLNLTTREETRTITDWEYKFARIVQPPQDDLDYYLNQAGIKVK